MKSLGTPRQHGITDIVNQNSVLAFALLLNPAVAYIPMSAQKPTRQPRTTPLTPCPRFSCRWGARLSPCRPRGGCEDEARGVEGRPMGDLAPSS
jgi:hypothetical protein